VLLIQFLKHLLQDAITHSNWQAAEATLPMPSQKATLPMPSQIAIIYC